MAAGNPGGSPYAAAAARRSANVHSPIMSEGFLCDAEAALAVFRGTRRGSRLDPNQRLKTLTLSLNEKLYRAAKPYWMLRDNVEQADDEDRVCGLALAHLVTSQLEELCLHRGEFGFDYRPRLEFLACGSTLRVLELKHCHLDPPARSSGLALPVLTELRLKGCFVSEGYLQVVVDAATALAKLVLVNVRYKKSEKSFGLGFRLRCQTITALVLDTRGNEKNEALAESNGGVEVDMPSLLDFSYTGFPIKLSLMSPAPELTRVNIDTSRYDDGDEHYEPTAGMIRSFSSTRSLTLRMRCIEDIVAGKVILPTFPNLKLLEVNGEYKYMNNDSQLAVARLLGSCPVISELRLRLNIKPDNRFWRRKSKDPPGGAFGVSMDRFKRLAYAQGGNGTTGVSEEISELTALSSCWFSCLRKVTLRFKAANQLDCFPVQLAKFLVENAMVLEEMHVDDGLQFWTDHLCNNLARWRADSFRRKNLPDTGGFKVYKCASA